MASLEHRHLRSAIQFAVAIAEEGQKRRPPIAYPAALKPFFKQDRIPGGALGPLRRAIEADPDFRRRLAAGALPELVDPIGTEWLRREDGWESRIAELVAAADTAASMSSESTALRRAEKRREAAEQAAIRTRAELVQREARLDELVRQLEGQRRAAGDVAAEAESLKAQLAEARLAARHANDRAEAARSRLAGVEAERDAAAQRATTAEVQRDALLADRVDRSGGTVSGAQVSELRELAKSARGLADRLSGLVDVGRAGRVALSLPGGVARDSRRATEHLLRAVGARVLVDGYNVAKLAWPDDDLAAQRMRCLDLVDDVARRFGSDVTVVFDGADVVGAHAPRRRLARVVYSPVGVTADDVIRAEVAGTPVDRPVVVVTNDQAIRRDVAAAGANLVTSDALLELR